MKIVYLGAGAAGRYCGTCLHDNALAAELVKQGHDALLVPTYTPIRTDEENVSQSRVFFGGVNVYLQQHSALFRHTPWFLDAMLDGPKILAWLSRRSAGMPPSKLGALTVSTLQGEHGRQRKEIEKLVHWLATEIHPDVVHLSNAMLCGVAKAIRARLNVPIICSLAGEDIFLEQLTPPYYQQSRDLLKERAADIDVFVALNHYFADFMRDYMDLRDKRVEVIPHGLNLNGYGTRVGGKSGVTSIGYFARVAPEKGLHVLAEALVLLCADTSLPPVRLKVAGYMSSADVPYFDAVKARIAAAGLSDRFEYVGEVDREQKLAFLQSLDLVSVPTIYHESKGISVMEAMANAVPVVLPAHGVFPEMIADSGGGILHAPENPQALADALRQLVLNPREATAMGLRGQAAIRQNHTAAVMASKTADLYRRMLLAQHREPAATN